MEDVCSLAMVSKYFYKQVDKDFKRLCYNHVVYRLKGETWAYAFLNFGARAYNSVCNNKNVYDDNALCCPFTGKIAIYLRRGYVLMTNIDFGLNEFTILDFTSYTTHIMFVSIVNKGEELLVRARYIVVVYNLHASKVTHVLTGERSLEFYMLQAGGIVDYYTKKEFRINAAISFFEIHYINRYDKVKYIVVRTTNDQLVVIDNVTDERQVICRWRDKMNVYVINENDSVVILGSRAHNQGCQVYCLRRRRFVFDQVNDDQWFLFNSTTLFKPADMTFLVYNKQISNWKEIRPNPALRLERRCECYLTVNFVPLPAYQIMESFQDDVAKRVFLRFRPDGVEVKTFNAEVEFIPEKHNNYQFIQKDNHHIAQLIKPQYTMNKEEMINVIAWFNQQYNLNPSVPLLDAETGAVKHRSDFFSEQIDLWVEYF
ncbi:unnamed protein product [Bursaphelenchus okinawaensis]|nr:unnamed protein product [Bursaphelenchus okinawaensis]CAG9127915.1 unnamed protein product [Bursaphelenchus okinawaensis]